MKSIIGGIKNIKPICRVKPCSGCEDNASPSFAPLDKGIEEYTAEELCGILAERGVKIPSPTNGKQYKLLLVNFAESDTGVTLNSRLALTYPERITDGITILMKIFGVRRCVCTFPRSMYKEANGLIDVASERKYISFKVISDVYPLHIPYMLVSYLYNTEISPSKDMTSTSYGYVTPEICLDVYNALALGIEKGKYFSLEGDAEGKLICAKADKKTADYVPGGFFGYTGGAVNHKIITDGDTIAGADGIVILKKPIKEKKEFECDFCGMCNAVCPVKINPSDVMRGINKDLSLLCVGCGCCDYACPSGVKIKDKVLEYKAEEINSAKESEDGEKV